MKISVIIPTRDRARYLGASIASVLAADDPDLELIVSNNASHDNTADVVAREDDPRLRYLETDGRVSMRQNFNMALLQSTGDYVIFIGDDDALLPGQLPYLRALIEQHRPDGLSWFKATYGWPIDGFGNKTGGIRFYKSDCFHAPTAYDPKGDMDHMLACRLSSLDPAPNIYHGCVSRAYLDRIAPAPDVYFDGTIPDVNFSFRATFLGGNFLHLRHPFTINGYGPASTGGAHAAVKPGSPSDKVGKDFTADNRADPYDDIMDHALTVQLVYFSTLETLRARGGFQQHQPDYREWYHFALSALLVKPEVEARLQSVLDAHAKASGTQDQLAQARALPPRAKRSLRERLARVQGQLGSFRLWAELDGQNTVFTAARMFDTVLGSGLGDVMSGTSTPQAAWRAAKTRARAFTRQL